jgi:phosphonate transport system permease protein
VIITVASTVVGILISIPIGLRRRAQHRAAAGLLICRGIVAVSGRCNEIIVAILLVAMFRLRPASPAS